MGIAVRFLTTAAAVMMLSTPGFSQDAPTKETVVATVKGTDITLGHILALANRLPEQYANVADDRLFAGILDQLIQQELLSNLVEKETPELQLATENEIRALFAGEAIQGIYTAALTKEAIQAEYTATYLGAEPVPEYSASHILVETEEQAKDLVKLLDDGTDFAELAKQKSTGPSGPSGGDLGWTGPGGFVPAFEAAMIALEVGQISAPVKTQFGWHIIKLNDKRNRPAPELALVREEIENVLREAALDKALAELETAANVVRKEQEIDPSVVRKFELLKE